MEAAEQGLGSRGLVGVGGLEVPSRGRAQAVVVGGRWQMWLPHAALGAHPVVCIPLGSELAELRLYLLPKQRDRE